MLCFAISLRPLLCNKQLRYEQSDILPCAGALIEFGANLKEFNVTLGWKSTSTKGHPCGLCNCTSCTMHKYNVNHAPRTCRLANVLGSRTVRTTKRSGLADFATAKFMS
jgi:hypothetical protein